MQILNALHLELSDAMFAPIDVRKATQEMSPILGTSKNGGNIGANKLHTIVCDLHNEFITSVYQNKQPGIDAIVDADPTMLQTCSVDYIRDWVQSVGVSSGLFASLKSIDDEVDEDDGDDESVSSSGDGSTAAGAIGSLSNNTLFVVILGMIWFLFDGRDIVTATLLLGVV